MLSRTRLLLAVGCLAVCGVFLPLGRAQKEKPPTPDELTQTAVRQLITIQEEGGQWPYEGVYRVQGQLPVGYRVGGTAIVAGTLLHAAPNDKEARAAMDRGLAFVLKELGDPLMAPSTENRYDVRVWGHAFALDFLCQMRAAKAAGDRAADVDQWIGKLVQTLITEEIPGGGWNYASRSQQAAFVTAPVTQALLLAHSQGEKIPDEVFQRARKVLEASRGETGAFVYSGNARRGADTRLPGSAARSAVCETTLVLLGGGSIEAVQAAVDAFFKHWDELHKRWQKKGTHEGEYLIAPYYFYYGHRYAAQAISLLPEKARQAERDRLLATILKTRDADGTWNDRIFPRTRNYGTSMIVLALMGDRTPLPPKYGK